MIEDLYLRSRKDRPPLRIGVLLDNLDIGRPFATVLDQILRSDFAQICCLVLNRQPPTALPDGRFERYLRLLREPERRNHLLYALYQRLDCRLFGGQMSQFQTEQWGSRLDGIPVIEVQPLVKGFVHRFPEEALEQVRTMNLDVMLRFGFNILRGGILSAAQYGVWSYHHGDNDFYRGGPAHFWEMEEDNALSGVILQVLTDVLDGGLVLTKVVCPTTSRISLLKNRSVPYRTASSFVIRKLWELHQQGFDHLRNHAVPAQPYQGKRKLYRTPDNWEAGRFLIKSVAETALRRVRNQPTVFHWRIGVRIAKPEVAPSVPSSLHGFEWLNPPRGRFWADPFIGTRNGTAYVLFEDYNYATAQGVISAAELRTDGTIGPVEPVLKTPYHLSYPFLWQQDGETFLIPESGQNGTVELYRAEEFPYRWKLEKTLFRGPAYDTTVWYQDDRYWFFVSLMDTADCSPQLFLFHSDSLTGEWVMHPSSPILLDVRTARCGGGLFLSSQGVIRPAQDGSRHYGYALRFQRVVTLNPMEYSEEQVQFAGPEAILGASGTHTYNRLGRFEVLDGRWTEPRRLHLD